MNTCIIICIMHYNTPIIITHKYIIYNKYIYIYIYIYIFGILCNCNTTH